MVFTLIAIATYMIKLITFDLDNTLWDINPVIIAAEKRLRNWVAEQVPEAVAHLEMDQLKQVYKKIREEHPELLHHPTNFRKKILHTVFSRVQTNPEPAASLTEKAFQVFYEGRNQITLFHQAEAILKNLSQRYPLIALSNGNANLTMIGIDQYFKAHFSSETEGKAKPHKAMFERALAFSQIEAHQAIHIGDHPIEDVEAASKLGFSTIWFNQNQQQDSTLCNPTEQIHNLDQLESAVYRIEQLKKNPNQ